MDSNQIVLALDQLADFYAQRDVLALQKQELIDQVLTAEIKAKLADIDSEFGTKGEAVSANIADLESTVKAMTLTNGETVKGSHLQAVWVKGRVSWDDKGLSGYAKAHPEIESLRKQGDPSVSLRKIG